MRFIFALLLGKIVFFILRIRGNRGTALPGLVVEKIDPNFLAKARSRLEKVIVITGTNGKTSTQTVLAKILAGLSGERVLVNSRGANLSRGLVSEIVKQFSLGTNSFKYAVFEVEEATLPRVISQISPDIAVITNFFRDQLDAYGEISRTKAHVRKALEQVPELVVVANGDDPQVLDCLTGVAITKSVLVNISDYDQFINYESSDREHDSFVVSNAAKVNYPVPQINADLSSEVNWDGHRLKINLPGFHSVYAVALAIETAKLALGEGFSSVKTAQIIADISPAFGRGEILSMPGTDSIKDLDSANNLKPVQIFLVKNPVGFDITLDLLSHLQEEFSLVLLVNDKIADGRDVSWLWDSRLEKLGTLKLKNIIYGGSRGLDMQLRVKYAGDFTSPQAFETDMRRLLEKLKDPHYENIKVIATYTAMNQFRDYLLRKISSEASQALN